MIFLYSTRLVGGKVNKNIVIAVLIIGILSSLKIIGNYYQETNRLKSEIGGNWSREIGDAYYAARELKEINIKDVMNDEYGYKYVETLSNQVFDTLENVYFRGIGNYEMFSLISNVKDIQKALLDGKKVSEEEFAIYKDQLQILSFILFDIYNSKEKYKMFTEGSLELNIMIEKRINKDY